MTQDIWASTVEATQEFAEDIVAMVKTYPDHEVESKRIFNTLAPRVPAELHDLAYAIVCYTVLYAAGCQTEWD